MTPSFASFSDELVKIAFLQRLANGFTNALHEGWNGTGPEGSPTRNTWMGRGRDVRPTINPTTGLRSQMGTGSRLWEEASSLGGLTKALPVGAKAMMAIPTAMMAAQALHKYDPTGQERSRTERVTGLAANTVGGLAGSAAATRLLAGRGGGAGAFAAPLIGGMLGGTLAEKAVTAPFRAARAQRMGQAQPQPFNYVPQESGPDGGVPA